jgi:hypothetical protein
MKFGEISSILPETDMREYYAEMEPIMLKYFGPPFSDFTLNVEASLDPQHDFGIFPENHNAVMVSQAIIYANRNNSSDPGNAIRNIQGFMKHEFSHAMYVYDYKSADFGAKWPGEGWAKVLEELMDNEIDNISHSARFSYESYLDKETVAGEEAGGQKQSTNHGLIYSMTASTHLLLFSAASSSNENLDFYKKMNNAKYDLIKSKNDAHITLDEYKNLMKPLLAGIKIDGVDAYQWYFNSPLFYKNENMGSHIGVYLSSEDSNLEPKWIQVFAFNRVQEGNSKKEQPLEGINIDLKLTDSQGNLVLEKNLITDKDGNSMFELRDKPEIMNSLEAGAYFLNVEATINNEVVKNKIFAFVPPKIEVKKEYIYGVLLDENNNILDGKYVSLLTADSDFIYKKNGFFMINVPDDKRVVNLEFLGLKQEVTKGPFARVYAFKIPNSYIESAKSKSDEELNKGIIDNTKNFIGGYCGDHTCDENERKNPENCPRDCSVTTTQNYENRQPLSGGEDINRPEKISFFTRIKNWFLNLFRR